MSWTCCPDATTKHDVVWELLIENRNHTLEWALRGSVLWTVLDDIAEVPAIVGFLVWDFGFLLGIPADGGGRGSSLLHVSASLPRTRSDGLRAVAGQGTCISRPAARPTPHLIQLYLWRVARAAAPSACSSLGASTDAMLGLRNPLERLSRPASPPGLAGRSATAAIVLAYFC